MGNEFRDAYWSFGDIYDITAIYKSIVEEVNLE